MINDHLSLINTLFYLNYMREKLNGDVFDMNQNHHLSEKHILLVTLSV
jgi:hypothetical protein